MVCIINAYLKDYLGTKYLPLIFVEKNDKV